MKPDPIEVENTFRRLIFHLERTESVRHRYILLLEFLHFLDGGYKKYASYISQIVEIIPVFVGPIVWCGINPKELEESLFFLETVLDELHPQTWETSFADILRRFKEVNILLYCCLNHCDKATAYVHELFDLRHLDGAGEVEVEETEPVDVSQHLNRESTLRSLKQLLEQILDKKPELSDAEQQSADRLLEQIGLILAGNSDTVLIPVAEIHKQENRDVEYGRLRSLSIEIYGATEKEDQLIQNFRRYGAEKQDNHDENRAALKAARTLFNTDGFNPRRRFYNGGLFFELTGAIHHGSSADLAISVLWYTKLVQITRQREQYKIKPNVVFTGAIDANGNVRPVNQESISSKMEAAFFSWAQTVVVPESQKQHFEETLDRLKTEYPTKRIELVAVSHLEDLLDDRRVMTEHTLSWWEVVKGRVFGGEV